MTESTFQKDSSLWVSGFLILSVLFVYAQVLQHEFITYDDPIYIGQNEVVIQGLSWEGVQWAMTAVVSANWHPLTMLSHMLDVQLFGANAVLHHFINVLLHAANAVLLFHVLRRMSGCVWRPALVAVLFALHPLRVESVAWAAERKDTLSVLFLLLTMFAYCRYVERRATGRYLLVMLLFALGLMAKSMLVTLPFALLLLDFWPFRRVQLDENFGKKLGPLIVEKLPLFALSATTAGIAVFTQHQSEATGNLATYAFGLRLENAVLSYGMYLWNTIAPYNLVILYPHALTEISHAAVFLSGVVILAITVAALSLLKTRPYFAVGWFWYLGTLVPVIGILQVGSSGRADHYTYIPHIGLFVAVVWGLAEGVERWPRIKRPVLGAVAAVVLALTALSYMQTRIWKNDLTLFTRTLEVSPNSSKAHFSLGVGYIMQDRYQKGVHHFERSIELNPNHIGARKNLGAALVDLGRPDEAEVYFRDIIRMETYEPEHYINLAVSVYLQAKYDEAVFWAEEALRIDSDYQRAHDLIERCQRSVQPEIDIE